jgi:hypothetical protein
VFEVRHAFACNPSCANFCASPRSSPPSASLPHRRFEALQCISRSAASAYSRRTRFCVAENPCLIAWAA